MDRAIIIYVVALLVVSFPCHSSASGDFDPAEYDIVASEMNRREYILRFTPNAGYLAEGSSSSYPIAGQTDINKKLKSFDYILLNTDLDIQIYRNWFATGSFIYSHAFYNDPVGGGIDIFGIPFGIRYVLLESDYVAYTTDIIDRLRYWVGASVGPYIKNESITIDLGARSTHGSSTNTAVGVGAHIGFDYFLGPNIGLGIQVKVQYINFDDDIIIFSGGPSLIGRF